MKLLEAPVKISYSNPILEWYEKNTKQSQVKGDTFENGMLITINNKDCYYKHLSSQFREVYISILNAIGYKLRRTDVKEMVGEWKGKRVILPSRQILFDLLNKKTPILLCGVHNYKRDDYRSKGKENTHSHYYLYNIHHYLPSGARDLMKVKSKIKDSLGRYVKSKNYKRFQEIIDITQVRDNVSPLQLYDYLSSPNTNPEKANLINYIASNRHLPNIQYPLTTIYSTKNLCLQSSNQN